MSSSLVESRKPFANGLLSIFNFVIYRRTVLLFIYLLLFIIYMPSLSVTSEALRNALYEFSTYLLTYLRIVVYTPITLSVRDAPIV